MNQEALLKFSGKAYTGIGSRSTPFYIGQIMTDIAIRLSDNDMILRSGGAEGADTYFEDGAIKKEIYLPWPGFNDSNSELVMNSADPKYLKIAEELAIKFHPGYNRLSQGAKKLMVRNSYQILGPLMDNKTSFVICWTPDGCNSHKTRTMNTGGTGQAISIADYLGIPIYNLNNPNTLNMFKELISNC